MAKTKLKIGNQLRGALTEALAYERGETVHLRVSEFPPPPKPMGPNEIRKLRQSLNVSQPVFATLLNVSPKAVQSWEQGARRPRAAALKLLAMAREDPTLLLRA